MMLKNISFLTKRGSQSVDNDVVKKYSFLTKLEATEEEILEEVRDLWQTYPEVVDMNLVGKVKHFLHIC